MDDGPGVRGEGTKEQNAAVVSKKVTNILEGKEEANILEGKEEANILEGKEEANILEGKEEAPYPESRPTCTPRLHGFGLCSRDW